ncbi:hypothetical protein [Mycetocola reblochoni]|uniref:Transmembrane protein n=2 Tax=Mycetocola reblochoni TaxID=331618 RepID=A0A1R4IFE3_9MICO|nr:hypothetical protein [Mycetocola reblochoni]RLP68990.1 hypothetical protein D9V30_08950 [Mycetocola reblochoni]SJN18552.1 hypothetical protein FM119_01470 [Mycetocola reblochoni REB411]
MSTPAEPTGVHREQVTVRRAPRLVNFGLVGVILGIVAALVLTFAFEPNQDYTRLQVFGFLLLICLTAGIALMMAVAVLLERLVGRRTLTAVADRIEVNDAAPASAPEAGDADDTTTAADPTPEGEPAGDRAARSPGAAEPDRSVDN